MYKSRTLYSILGDLRKQRLYKVCMHMKNFYFILYLFVKEKNNVKTIESVFYKFAPNRCSTPYSLSYLKPQPFV